MRRNVHPPPSIGDTSLTGGARLATAVPCLLPGVLWRAVAASSEMSALQSMHWKVDPGLACLRDCRSLCAKSLRAESWCAGRAGLAFKGSAFGASEAQQTLDVNFYGTRRVTEALLPLIPEGGAVVNVCRWALVLPPRAPAPAMLVRHT